MISALVPSRGRPELFARMYQSLVDNAAHPSDIETICWLDEDDTTAARYPTGDRLQYVTGERQTLTQCWNNLIPYTTGDIFMQCGDDLTFNTPGWDNIVRNAFAQVPDRILFAHGNDLGPNAAVLGTAGFVHRKWVDTVGYLLPPIFSSDWADVWLTEVADMIGRRRYLPDMVIEHHHYIFGKAERDQTYAEREERGERDQVVRLFKRTQRDRVQDAEKLRAVLVG